MRRKKKEEDGTHRAAERYQRARVAESKIGRRERKLPGELDLADDEKKKGGEGAIAALARSAAAAPM